MKMVYSVLVALAGSISVVISSAAHATPAQVVIVRHAEKGPTGPHVNHEGCERAFGLVSFFRANPIVNRFGPAVALYAMEPSAPPSDDPDDDKSLRPIETLAPTAVAMGLPIQANYKKADGADLTAEILSNPAYNGRTVIIAWEHDAIASLAINFGSEVSVLAEDWPGSVFDEAWVINFAKLQQIGGLKIIPEMVLPIDNAKGGPYHWQATPDTNKACELTSTCLESDGFGNFDISGGQCNDSTALDAMATRAPLVGFSL